MSSKNIYEIDYNLMEKTKEQQLVDTFAKLSIVFMALTIVFTIPAIWVKLFIILPIITALGLITFVVLMFVYMAKDIKNENKKELEEEHGK